MQSLAGQLKAGTGTDGTDEILDFVKDTAEDILKNAIEGHIKSVAQSILDLTLSAGSSPTAAGAPVRPVDQDETPTGPRPSSHGTGPSLDSFFDVFYKIEFPPDMTGRDRGTVASGRSIIWWPRGFTDGCYRPHTPSELPPGGVFKGHRR